LLKTKEEEKLSNERRADYILQEIKRLESTSSINGINIWYITTSEGDIGTVNGLRFGRLPSHQTPWSEINAAWGLCALLLYLLAKERKMTFSMYRIHPMGSHSKMEDIESKKVYDLFFTSPRQSIQPFNQAMKCYLSCLKELSEFVEKKRAEKKHVLHSIEEDSGKIGNYSVEYRSDSEVNWTRALKYLVIDLKYLQKM
jgi:beclin 1